MSWVEVPGVNSSLTPMRLERGDVLGRNDAAAEHRDVLGALLAQQLEHALRRGSCGRPRARRARWRRRPPGPPWPRSARASGAGRCRSPRSRRRAAPARRSWRRGRGRRARAWPPPRGSCARPSRAAPPRAARIRSPTFTIARGRPGTSFQSKPLPSPVQRGIRCRWKCGTDWNAAAPLAWSTLRPSGLSAALHGAGDPLGGGDGRLQVRRRRRRRSWRRGAW